jgi:hypothetical protein
LNDDAESARLLRVNAGDAVEDTEGLGWRKIENWRIMPMATTAA